MSGKKETYVYGSLRERFALEWKIFALAFVFILIADNIGQIKIPVGKGMFILFPIFYAIILGVLSGPQVLKIVDNRHVKAASKLVSLYRQAGNHGGSKHRHHSQLRACASAARLRQPAGAAAGNAHRHSAGYEAGGRGRLPFHQPGIPYGADQ